MALKQNAQITLTARDKTKLAFRSINTGLGRMQKAVMGLTKLMPALAVGFSAVALVQFTKNAFKTADAIAKTADKIGLTTKSLQELRFGAKLSGVETNTLDMAMQRFSRRLGEALQGTGELKQTLIDYGIAVRNVDGSSRSVDAVLNDFANTKEVQELLGISPFLNIVAEKLAESRETRRKIKQQKYINLNTKEIYSADLKRKHIDELIAIENDLARVAINQLRQANFDTIESDIFGKTYDPSKYNKDTRTGRFERELFND